MSIVQIDLVNVQGATLPRLTQFPAMIPSQLTMIRCTKCFACPQHAKIKVTIDNHTFLWFIGWQNIFFHYRIIVNCRMFFPIPLQKMASKQDRITIQKNMASKTSFIKKSDQLTLFPSPCKRLHPENL